MNAQQLLSYPKMVGQFWWRWQVAANWSIWNWVNHHLIRSSKWLDSFILFHWFLLVFLVIIWRRSWVSLALGLPYAITATKTTNSKRRYVLSSPFQYYHEYCIFHRPIQGPSATMSSSKYFRTDEFLVHVTSSSYLFSASTQLCKYMIYTMIVLIDHWSRATVEFTRSIIYAGHNK